jgi:hypothetical protein
MFPKDNLMFYYIMPNGFPKAFESFEAYYETIRAHAVDTNENTVYKVRVPLREDFRSNDVPEGYGFDGRPMKIWERNGKFIGYQI